LEFSIFNIKCNSLIIVINGIFSQWKKIFYSLFLLLKNIFIVIFSSCRRLCIKFNRKYYFKVKKNIIYYKLKLIYFNFNKKNVLNIFELQKVLHYLIDIS